MYNSIKGSITGEYSEKKSKFIANGFYITSEEEAKEKLDELEKNILTPNIIVMHTEYLRMVNL